MLAFDRHMNLVIQDCQETRRTKADKVEKRTLGLVILRGQGIVSISVESVPSTIDKTKLLAGGGVSKSVGRGLPLAQPIGLTRPMAGIGNLPPGFSAR